MNIQLFILLINWKINKQNTDKTLDYQTSLFSPTCPLFQATELCPGRSFKFSKNVRVFLPLSIVTVSFSVVVTYIIARSFRRPRLNFRIYSTQFRWIRKLVRTALFRSFILNCLQRIGGPVERRLVSVAFYLVPVIGKKENVNSRTN